MNHLYMIYLLKVVMFHSYVKLLGGNIYSNPWVDAINTIYLYICIGPPWLYHWQISSKLIGIEDMDHPAIAVEIILDQSCLFGFVWK